MSILAISCLVSAALVGVVWLTGASARGSLPKRHSVLTWLLASGTLMPASMSGGVELVVLFGSWLEWLNSPRRHRGIAVLIFLIELDWLLLIFHPNVPSLAIGALGFRKTIFALSGVILGLSLRPVLVPRFVDQLALVSMVALGGSILVHFYDPSLEASITRNAGADSSLFDNQERLQGIFAGPFHVALLGVFVTLWALSRFRRRWVLGAFALSIGLLSVYFSYVRTALVAALVSALALAWLSGKVSLRVMRVLGLGLVSVAVVALATRIADLQVLLTSLTHASSDDRFLNRFAFYSQGLHLVGESPIIGWGAGSAGDTLEASFAGASHVNAHNLLLKVAVEGGFIGLSLWLALIILLLLRMDRTTATGRLAFCSFLGFLIFGITGSAIEAIPSSLFILAAVGASCVVARGEGPVNTASRFYGKHRPPRHLPIYPSTLCTVETDQSPRSSTRPGGHTAAFGNTASKIGEGEQGIASRANPPCGPNRDPSASPREYGPRRFGSSR